jgi:hypothetical protein
MDEHACRITGHLAFFIDDPAVPNRRPLRITVISTQIQRPIIMPNISGLVWRMPMATLAPGSPVPIHTPYRPPYCVNLPAAPDASLNLTDSGDFLSPGRQ